MLQCLHIVLCQEILDENRPVCWSIFVKGKPTVGSPSFRVVSFPKAMKDDNVHFLFTVTITVNYASECQ